ncbi:hypothetical protein ACPOL_6971 (plasmid) [Acidisarcina polymorpha]|uniref:Uncharacterized protein n=1 Tax=Acidisarcina polymorpha TaxID=2211140 RepID=A0A2Z5GC47_9BACT|nr:hypothetical protein ACPOL_6971 [Acidisarcina polymorpha]
MVLPDEMKGLVLHVDRRFIIDRSISELVDKPGDDAMFLECLSQLSGRYDFSFRIMQN